MTRRQIAALAGILLVLPGLAACDQQQLNAAAIVDGSKITVTEVQGALKDLHARQEQLGIPLQAEPTAADLVLRRIYSKVYDKAAADMGITITPGEFDTQADDLRKKAGGDDAFERAQLAEGYSVDNADENIRLTLIEIKMAEKLGAGQTLSRDQLGALVRAKLVEAAKSLDVRMNPRYGTFLPEEGKLQPYKYDYFK